MTPFPVASPSREGREAVRRVRRFWHAIVGHPSEFTDDRDPMAIRCESCGKRIGREDWP